MKVGRVGSSTGATSSGCGRTGEDNRIVNMAINVCYELHIGTAMGRTQG